MKKILYIAILFMFSFCLADVDFSEAIGTTSMPSDAEIMKVISQFKFDPKQKEEIFKETKKRLKEMYSNPDTLQSNEDLNANLKLLQDSSTDIILDPEKKQEALEEIKKLPSTKKGSVEETIE